MKKTPHPLPAALLTLALAVTLTTLAPGCANTQAGPSGGVTDTLPPTLLVTLPEVNATGVSTSLKHIELQFNEYVQLKDANKYIVLSPPPEKNPNSRTKGKGVVVDLERKLDSNTTYCLYFGRSISDNNEGNPFPAFALSFSTGATVDSLMYSGMVVDAATMAPVDNATVLLHLNREDSAFVKTKPVAATKTDPYGYFTLRNLKDTLYTLYALLDNNNNFQYENISGEQIAFTDSLIRPHKVMFTYAQEIQPYFEDDTVGLLKRPLETALYLFKEKSTRQTLRERTRPQKRALLFKFGAPYAQIDSLHIDGIDSTGYVLQRNFYRDSLIYWITASHLPDTLHVRLSYLKTNDSTLLLEPVTDTLRFAPPQEKKEEAQTGRGAAIDQRAAPKAPKKEMMDLKVTVVPETVDYTGVTLKFPALPVLLQYDSIQVNYVANKDTLTEKFHCLRDSLDLCTYYLFLDHVLEGTDYSVYFPRGTFKDIYGLESDSLVTRIAVPKSEDLSQLSLALQQVATPLRVDLLNENQTSVLRTHYVEGDTTVHFKYLKEGKYAVRFLEDINHNGEWDPGRLDLKRHPERVRLLTLQQNNSVIELKEKMELTQQVNITELLNRPLRLTKPMGNSGSGSGSRRR